MSMVEDLLDGVRMLVRHPRSSLLIAGLLALGIGACTIVFSLFDAVLLRSLPVRRPDRLVILVQHYPKPIGTRSELPLDYYRALHDRAKSLAAFGETDWPATFVMTQPAPAAEVTLRGVTANYFQELGVSALYGRVLLPSDAHPQPGMPPAVVSYDFWRRRFNDDTRVVGRQSILINKRYFAVVGVVPAGFKGTSADTATDVWIPVSTFPSIATFSMQRIDLELDGRLRPGFTLTQAQAECRTIFRPVMKNYYLNVEKLTLRQARTEIERKVTLQSLARGTSFLRQSFGRALKLLMASVGLLLLVVCSNVGALLLAQAAARQQELAVRQALGATRARLVRQALTEAFLLSVLGAAGGLLIARAAAPVMVRLIPPMRILSTTLALVPISINAGINGQVLWFVLGVVALTMLLFSLTPTLAISRSRIENLLRASRSSSGVRGRQALIALQITLCTFLLAMAGLFVRTLDQLNHVDTGMDVNHIETFSGDLTGYKNRTAFLKMLAERVRDIPGVISCAFSGMGVMREHGMFGSVAPAGHRITRANYMDSAIVEVSPDYFETMGMRMLAGRGFIVSDVAKPKQKGPVMAVVNEAFAQRFFLDANTVGKLFGFSSTHDIAAGTAKADYKIIGVVSDAKNRSMREPILPTYYVAQTKFDGFVLYVRTHMHPEAIVEPVRKVWHSTGPGVPFLEIDTLAQEARQTTANERLTAALTSLFGGIAALLAGVGIYGLLAYVVTERRREIGIRMALGAQRWDIAKLIGAQNLSLILAGIAGGLGLALITAPAVRSLLYGISPQDPKSLAGAVLFVVLAATLATLFPVLTAIRTEPARTLREER